MAVYRFRIVFEDQEDVLREIEIQGKQTFEEFHNAIQEAIGFDNSKEASFFMSDDYWRKGQEITSRKLEEDDDDDDYRRPVNKKPAKSMKDCKIAGFIDDPHQKIVYVFDPAAKWTLLIELFKITEDVPKTVYPRCVKSAGAAPKQYKQVIAPPVDEDDEEEDEEDKKAREKVFAVVEEFEEGDEDIGEVEDSGEEESESESEGDSEEESSEGEDDFGASYGEESEEY